MSDLILIRHGQSVWNKENRFTGWYDIGLSKNGKAEAEKAGVLLKEEKINIDVAYTSLLKRAQNTLYIILNILEKKNIICNSSWQLNERHYGSLTGLNKEEMKKKLGVKKIHSYRRSWDIAPPELSLTSPMNPRKDAIYKSIEPKLIPDTESLKDTYERVIPYYEKHILPLISQNKNIIIAAHGNSLRALCKKILNISNIKINELEIPTGNPLLIRIQPSGTIIDCYYLDNERGKKIIRNE